jgi:hypothetical protein
LQVPRYCRGLPGPTTEGQRCDLYAVLWTALRIRDWGLGAFLTPGSVMGRKSASGSGIRDEQPGPDHIFKNLETIFCLFLGKIWYLNS